MASIIATSDGVRNGHASRPQSLAVNRACEAACPQDREFVCIAEISSLRSAEPLEAAVRREPRGCIRRQCRSGIITARQSGPRDRPGAFKEERCKRKSLALYALLARRRDPLLTRSQRSLCTDPPSKPACPRCALAAHRSSPVSRALRYSLQGRSQKAKVNHGDKTPHRNQRRIQAIP